MKAPNKFNVRLGHAIKQVRREDNITPIATPITPAAGRNIAARLRNGEDGSALVEFSMVLPLLLLVMTGIFTFGIALNSYIQLTEATAVGARVLAISRGQTLDPCNTAATAVYTAAPLLSTSKFNFTFVLNGTTYTGNTCSSSSNTTGSAANLVEGGSAEVEITYPCNLTVYGYNYAPSCYLQAETTEIVQ